MPDAPQEIVAAIKRAMTLTAQTRVGVNAIMTGHKAVDEAVQEAERILKPLIARARVTILEEALRSMILDADRDKLADLISREDIKAGGGG